jgi:glutathione S-transferase
MNCRKQFDSIKLTQGAKQEIERIKYLWKKYRNEFGSNGKWLFGDYTIADAMFAPIALRFNGYNIPLNGVEKEYVNHVLNDPYIMEWVDAGTLETEVIEAGEAT